MAYKQAILIRADLKLPKGKAAAQAAHASVEAVLRTEKSRSGAERVRLWRNEGMAKIVLKVADDKELIELNERAKAEGLVTAMITDAGRTVVAPGTRTCCGIGPASEAEIDRILGELKLY